MDDLTGRRFVIERGPHRGRVATVERRAPQGGDLWIVRLGDFSSVWRGADVRRVVHRGGVQLDMMPYTGTLFEE